MNKFNIFLLTIIFLKSTVCFASYGTVSYLRGSAYVLKNKNKNKIWQSLKLNSKVFSGSKIKTDKKTIIRLKSNTNTMLIGPNSLIEFSILGTKKSVLNLVKGFIWSKVNKNKLKNIKLIVHTKNKVSLAVRGTQFAFLQNKEGDLACVCEGAVELQKDSQKKMLTHGQGLNNYASSKEKKIDYLKMMTNGVPKVEFIKLAKKDQRYNQCLYCHNDDFTKDQFIMPKYADLIDFDYD